MKAIEIVELIKQTDPKLLGKTSDKKVAKIIARAFAEVRNQINSTDDGVVKVPYLGNFKLKQVEREKDGQKKSLKKLSFRVSKPKTKNKVKPEEAASE